MSVQGVVQAMPSAWIPLSRLPFHICLWSYPCALYWACVCVYIYLWIRFVVDDIFTVFHYHLPRIITCEEVFLFLSALHCYGKTNIWFWNTGRFFMNLLFLIQESVSSSRASWMQGLIYNNFRHILYLLILFVSRITSNLEDWFVLFGARVKHWPTLKMMEHIWITAQIFGKHWWQRPYGCASGLLVV